ncbi:SLATT domain-containing protein [Pseudomonas coleopterorum]|uniref:SLATT domain-containing protein n=1 Tax=Pseudomonas coleopterorum TaxID=1605838 RepID=UPI002A6996D9|nr:SLATT domain-containing protein [Pseudomonas coleopterorum]MDY1046968.1 SLATT domain-containing protein [Pseudomonas coleopterorum]
MRDKVWFTYKARIQAHKRLEWLDFHSQLLLVWYAILSTALGVLTIRHATILGPDTDVMATILSVALLGISLAVANRDFRGRAMLMRTNYLELQKLHRGMFEGSPGTPPPAPTPVQISRYDELLAESENHREIDDRIARVFASGTITRPPSGFEYFSAMFWLTMRFLITALLYALPVLAGLYAFGKQP